MAENKKSFIIYTSWKRWLDGLNLEQKGKWLDWMLSYTNDENPQFPSDQAVMIACMMAQDTLKRDLKKYEAKVERIKSARNQNKTTNMDTDNIPSTDVVDTSDPSLTGSGNMASSSKTTDVDEKHKFDVIASFKVYNIPLNRKTITNVKSSEESAAPDTLGTDATTDASGTTVY